MPYTIDPIDDIAQDGRRVQRPDVAERNRAQPWNSNAARRAQVLAFIESYIAEHVNAPTIREIVEGCGLSSTSMATHYIGAMIRSGELVRTRIGERSYTTPRALAAVRAAYGTGDDK